MNLTLALACMIAIMSLLCGRCKAAPGRLIASRHNLENHPHIHGHAMEELMRDFLEDLVGEDEDGLRLSKRQHLGDYDHMRFGKRANDDDEYGRSRFSRNTE
ncbi:drosulfakinins isoform X2 [Harpegnathos saltator]|uniref:Uncharacterized protein n=2 Tax=Harpegnathos saltator TaxID=610380 RepID=E2BKP0_HARSA|nr:drosulfakinins isoform X2 [Harpegnathos saltator]XP_011140657.1 drosulfakinins isoform X2 [Harpegnathos saltator]EFN83738.1 hypothetical protein EAI_17127 [Harpegnathos saltator]